MEMLSWDFFDTLCGRKTGHEPWRLFDVVGGHGYRAVRQEAERRSDKTWNGIFATLQTMTGWPALRVRQLQDAEWQAELDAAFPIAANVAAVADGDRIVTDTYFSEAQIRELADRIGVPRSVEIVASWDGKHSGRWWKTPQAKAASLHVGDNARSDYSQATANGCQARLFAAAAQTQEERSVASSGRWEVAAAMRAARLSSPHAEGSPDQRLWVAAAQANVWFLMLAAGLVVQHARRAGVRRVQFVSRDTLLLREAFAAAAPDIEAGTFWASRETLKNPSKSFIDYARESSRGSLICDLHGTGLSVRQFVDVTGVRLNYVFVCGQRRMEPHYPCLTNLNGIAYGTAVEVMNYDDQGRVIDVVDGQPVRADLEYDVHPVRVHRAAALAGIRHAIRWPSNVFHEELWPAAKAIGRLVDRRLLRQHQVHHNRVVAN